MMNLQEEFLVIDEYREEYPVSYRCPRITIKKGRCDGLPCVRKTEITAKSIAILAHNGATQQQVIQKYPELTMEDLLDVYIYYQGPASLFRNLELDYEEETKTILL
jgi:uncharacterized protein (DUF433 family)